MHYIERSILRFLQDVSYKPYKIPEHLLAKFSEETAQALKRQFEREARDFDLYPSNVGKPLCVLQMDKAHGSGGIDAGRAIFGNLVEATVLFLVHASGLKVVAEQVPLKYKLGGKELSGRADLIIKNPKGEDELYDIKSASDYSFKSKSEQSLADIFDTDYFGYVHQLFVYSSAAKVAPGGLIFCNKSDGNILVVPVPRDYDELRSRALAQAAFNIKHLNDPFKKRFDDVPETYRKNPTGNRMLRTPCTMCSHKFRCWPTLRIVPQQSSKSRNPKLVDYTFIKEQKDV